jgi:glycosyltransferase involved in cell wall biosynthesis
VALNRRLAHELANVGGDRWEVTVAGPSFFHGDLRPVPLERLPSEPCKLVGLPAYLTRRIHVMVYGPRLRSLLREPWDLVHCWEEPFIFAAGQAAMWCHPAARLVFATFQNLSKRYPPPFSWVEQYAMGQADGWVAFGHLIEDVLTRRKLYRDRPHRVIPPGVDVQQFKPDPARRAQTLTELNWSSEGPPVVGFVGRFVPEKGLRLLTEVLDAVRSPWRALFLGGGSLESYLRDWSAKYGERVRILTEVTHSQVPAYMNCMDVLAAPSQSTPRWREQFGRMLVEAFASGVAVLASDSGEIPFVVGDAGLIRPEADREQWQDGLQTLLENPAFRTDVAARGFDRAHQEFAWPLVARRHLKFFDELLQNPRQRSRFSTQVRKVPGTSHEELSSRGAIL